VHVDDERAALWAFLATNVAVGINPIAVRFSNRELDPIWGAGFRFAAAALMFAAILAVLRLALPQGQTLRGAVVFGMLNFAGAVGFAYYAFVRVHAGLGQVVFALVPLATLLLAALQRQERLHAGAVAGACFALVGVLVLAADSVRDTVPLSSALALLASLLCVSQGAVTIRRFPSVHPVTLNFIGCSTAALVLIPLSLLSGETLAVPTQLETWVALGWVVFVGSGLMFMLYLVVLTRWAASRAAYVFVVSPLLTVALSAWLDDEPVGAVLVVGGLIILIGVYLGALRPRPEPVPAVPAP
jgi:drug/metabolite transporter (DMT)-like permease